ncbi:MAG: protein phosphatase 2C domain-containing protein [Nocardioidaceae bacterium]|nr:protein phosphatase 2C domain-containing protein [Nocardioidaceae bacterium]MCL2612691.1 protein phosphatase 2C domain-containing protein [Nocardioidaceae bacterium]
MTESDRPVERVDTHSADTIDLGESRTATVQRPRWVPLSATTIGSVHVRDGLPLQDAVLTWAEGDQAVIAVADGHGHRAHFRSDTGAALAVVSAVEEVRRLLPEVTDAGTATDVARRAMTAMVTTWTDKVRHHIEAHPFSEAEQALGAAADPLRPYGSTVLVVGVAADVMVVAQIGDGDVVLVDSRGEAFRPLPDDPRHDGVRTSSLCQPDPLDSLHVAAVDTGVAGVTLAFLCTDGFGNSRVDPDWWRQTGGQLGAFVATNGIAWVRDQLPGWLEEPARVGGDDTTMALIVRTD